MRTTSIFNFSTLLLLTMVVIVAVPNSAFGSGGSGVHILDRTGEKWDVGQAESVGFEPSGFQYGIGRHAFKTLDDSHLQSASASISSYLRVIGVATDNEAQAYAVSKLSRHEIANTTLNSKPIVVGY